MKSSVTLTRSVQGSIYTICSGGSTLKVSEALPDLVLGERPTGSGLHLVPSVVPEVGACLFVNEKFRHLKINVPVAKYSLIRAERLTAPLSYYYLMEQTTSTS